MTLLVGVLCRDGAVVAADRQASAMGVGMSARKVGVVNARSVFAASGDVAMGQRARTVLAASGDIIARTKYADAAPVLSEKLANQAVIPAHRVAKSMGLPFERYPGCQCLFASEFQDGLRLVCIDEHANFAELEERSRFLCLGSGAPNGLSFLTFIWSVFFADAPPAISEGVFAAYWTVQVAIELQSRNVGLGTDVCVLPDDPAQPARILSENELRENDNLIAEARTALGSVMDRVRGADASRKIPAPPAYR